MSARFAGFRATKLAGYAVSIAASTSFILRYALFQRVSHVCVRTFNASAYVSASFNALSVGLSHKSEMSRTMS